MTGIKAYLWCILGIFLLHSCGKKEAVRQKIDFTGSWKFFQGNVTNGYIPDLEDVSWRILDLPHDWSIEGEFSKDHPSKINGGALPTGIGWYRKQFPTEKSWKNNQVYIDFDGIYRNSEVWINGHSLGKRPSGYVGFRYDLTPFLKGTGENNLLAVRVDNSLQPNSRWYTGSGIYRNVWLSITSPVHIDHWGTLITAPEVSDNSARINLDVKIRNKSGVKQNVRLITSIRNPNGKRIATVKIDPFQVDTILTANQKFEIISPDLWSVNNPVLYCAETEIYVQGKLADHYNTPFGIRYFRFDPDSGFFLNGKHLKILGVNNHHDLGALGAAFNTRAAERQLEILKKMGCNAIRMSHNPPAPELPELCDRMGILVMDEAFDCWAKNKMAADYHLDWAEWHERDLSDLILRDRNHPSVFAWSIGNEIREQFDSTGIRIGTELCRIVKKHDPTRPVTCGLTEQDPAKNFIYQSKALDLICFNYKHRQYPGFPEKFPGECLLASENVSGFSTRGHYDQPSDSVRIWPQAYGHPFEGNPGLTASSYDNCHALWGATHEETWKAIKNNDFISGLFVWSGFDFLGEPEPYPWPARSSYYGIIDLAGFPKDIYYFYQSEWTDEPVLHLFPHWNWAKGEIIDVCAYYNHAEEVELFLNGKSLGKQSKTDEKLHVFWRVSYEPGTLKAVSRKGGNTVLEKEINTAGKASRIELSADRNILTASGKDLTFITTKVTDDKGNLVPDASDLIRFQVEGEGFIAGVDNGCQTSMESFKANHRKAFNGMCLLMVQAGKKPGKIKVHANSEGLGNTHLLIQVKE